MSTFAHFDLHNPKTREKLQIAFLNDGTLYLPSRDAKTFAAAGFDGVFVCAPNQFNETDNFVLYPAQWLLEFQGQSQQEALTGIAAFLDSLPVRSLLDELESESFFSARSRDSAQAYIEAQALTHQRMAEIISSAAAIATTSDDEALAIESFPNLAILLHEFAVAGEHHGMAEEIIKELLTHTDVITSGIAQGSIIIEYGYVDRGAL